MTAAAVTFLACATATPPRVTLPANVTVDSSRVTIPWDTLLIGVEALRDHVGAGFFDANQIHFVSARYSTQGYILSCVIDISHLEETRATVIYSLERDGTVSRLALPHCNEESSLCNIAVDRAAALRIARDHGLDLPDDYEPQLDYRPAGFLWRLSNNDHSREVPQEYRDIVIDAVTGEVVRDATSTRAGGSE